MERKKVSSEPLFSIVFEADGSRNNRAFREMARQNGVAKWKGKILRGCHQQHVQQKAFMSPISRYHWIMWYPSNGSVLQC